MTNANSFHSAIFVLLLFGVIYFVALGICKIVDIVKKKRRKKKEDEQS